MASGHENVLLRSSAIGNKLDDNPSSRPHFIYIH